MKMLFPGYHLRVCLLCSFMVAAVKSPRETKADCCGSPKDRIDWGIKDTNSAPPNEAFERLFPRDSSLKKAQLVDFGSIYQAHKSRWSSSKTVSTKTVKTSQPEPSMSIVKTTRSQTVHPKSALTDEFYSNAKPEISGVDQSRKTFTIPFEGFTQTFGQIPPTKCSQINQGIPKQDHVHPAPNSFLSSSQLLQSDAKQLFLHTEMDSRGSKNYNLPKIHQVSNQIEASSYIYNTEDHPGGAYANHPGFSGIQDAKVSGITSEGYAQSTFMYLKPQTSKSTPSPLRFGSSQMQSNYLASDGGATDGRQPAVNHFRAHKAWKTPGHRQLPGTVQKGIGPRSFPQYKGVSHGYASKRRNPVVGSDGAHHTGFTFRSLQRDKLVYNEVPRPLNLSVEGKFKPFHMETFKEQPVLGKGVSKRGLHYSDLRNLWKSLVNK